MKMIFEVINIEEVAKLHELLGNMLSKKSSDEIVPKRLIDILELSIRPTNCLKAEGIYTIESLITWSEKSLKRIPNFGQSSFFEIVDALNKIGLKMSSNQSATCIVDIKHE